jgi:hypothetical protein
MKISGAIATDPHVKALQLAKTASQRYLWPIGVLRRPKDKLMEAMASLRKVLAYQNKKGPQSTSNARLNSAWLSGRKHVSFRVWQQMISKTKVNGDLYRSTRKAI